MTETLAVPPAAIASAAPEPARLLRTVLRAPFRARPWKDLCYLLFAFVLSGVLLAYLYAGLLAAVFLSPFLAGAPLAVLVLSGRTWGSIHRPVVRVLLDDDLPGPAEFRARRGFFGWLGSAFGDAPGWRGLLFVVVEVLLGFGTGIAACVAVFTTAILVTAPVTTVVFHPKSVDDQGHTHNSVFQFGDFYFDTFPRTLLIAAIGLVALLVLPWLLRGLCLLHLGLARLLLTPTARDRRLLELQAGRRIALENAASTVQRLERDLHDGTQARLVAIAMALGRAEERLTTGGDATGLIAQARTDAKEALTELRELVRGIHPPALDLGLAPALETLAARCAVPVELDVDLPARPEPAIEATAYFAAAELLTNVVRHAGADRAELLVRPDGTGLELTVRDNGRGGAVATPHGGLAGLTERTRAVDGALTVDSPPGGPTVVTVTLPMAVPR
ncbi:sensor histidine kinase [Nocardia stercoris]|nr:sensor domain-containing protein [Nocardia stercoris]